MNKAAINVIYCDDIRNEMFGKSSLIGVYSSDLIVPTFPVTLPKLCAYITVKFPWGKQPSESLEVKLLREEEVLAQFAMDENLLRPESLPQPTAKTPKEEQLLTLQIGFTLTPLHLEAPTQLRVHHLGDGKLAKGNSLRIRLPSDEEQQMFGGPLSNGQTADR